MPRADLRKLHIMFLILLYSVDHVVSYSVENDYKVDEYMFMVVVLF